MRIGLYLHVPFCQAKCSYCDFASVAGQEHLFERYAQAIRTELAHGADPARYDVTTDWVADTVYMGGGTPSVLPLSAVRAIIETVQRAYAPPAGVEITVEVNPGTVDRAYLEGLREAGVNRLSVGVQSFDDKELRLLGRIHDRRRALETLTDARAAGFERLSLDLIYGLPGQTLADWERSLREALACRPSHISTYALSLEEGTPLAGRVARGELPAPDDDLAADMYEGAGEALAVAGYEHYEISNWALPGDESRHNLHTWRNGAYLGFGPAAHSHLGRRRWWNVPEPAEYLSRVEAGLSPMVGSEDLDEATDVAETVILGLRLVRDGVDVDEFRRRYGRTPADLYGSILEELEAWELIEITPARIRLSPRGRLLGNQVFARFLPDAPPEGT